MPSSNRVLEFSTLRHRADRPDSTDDSYSLTGPSPAMIHLWSQIRRVAPYFRTILLIGEPGTGAEAVAHALHGASPFYEHQLRVLPASAAELYFAYGGAHSRNPTNGILYLPDVEQLSAVAQRSVLRLARLRGPRASGLIAAAHNDLRALVSSGTFSAELAASLNALHVTLPPLRNRPEDLPRLLQFLFARHARQLTCPEPTLAPDFLQSAIDYPWPRNLEQMNEIVTWLLQNCPNQELSASEFAAATSLYPASTDHISAPIRLVRLETVVQEHLHNVLLACQGNKLRAAEVLGISRSTLYRMLDAASPTLLGRTG